MQRGPGSRSLGTEVQKETRAGGGVLFYMAPVCVVCCKHLADLYVIACGLHYTCKRLANRYNAAAKAALQALVWCSESLSSPFILLRRSICSQTPVLIRVMLQGERKIHTHTCSCTCARAHAHAHTPTHLTLAYEVREKNNSK